MNEIPISSLAPGTVLRVRSTRFPAVMHWGVVGYGRDSKGYPRVWHSQKSDALRCTDFEAFSAGQHCEIRWVPANPQQALWVIERLQAKEGLPWHLTNANCEMVVRWAVEDKPVSHQLAIGVLCAVGIAALAVSAR
jgi:hypothetical protein